MAGEYRLLMFIGICKNNTTICFKNVIVKKGENMDLIRGAYTIERKKEDTNYIFCNGFNIGSLGKQLNIST